MRPLANGWVTVFESPHPETVYCFSPGIARSPGGRLIATLDLSGPGVERLPGVKAQPGGDAHAWQGKVLTSDDRGTTWVHRADFPFLHARPFTAGDALYVLGHHGDLMIIRSDDEGETWTEPTRLTESERWHAAPCNVLHRKGCVYLAMEKRVSLDVQGWPVSELAPVLLRGGVDGDLCRRENWTFASELGFRDAVHERSLHNMGVPFFRTPSDRSIAVAPRRSCAPIGWLEANVVQIVDSDHCWFDPAGRTFHLWLRAHTGGTGYAAICRVLEQDDGAMVTGLARVPSGRPIVYVPCPGGQMKFHILYDEATALYWLLSSQATDSMTRAERLAEERYNLPNNERHRLQLHFSRNCIDWAFAGLVAVGPSPKQSRNYASMLIDGDDLHVLSRSGDARAASAHNGNLITFHTVRNFRGLVY